MGSSVEDACHSMCRATTGPSPTRATATGHFSLALAQAQRPRLHMARRRMAGSPATLRLPQSLGTMPVLRRRTLPHSAPMNHVRSAFHCRSAAVSYGTGILATRKVMTVLAHARARQLSALGKPLPVMAVVCLQFNAQPATRNMQRATKEAGHALPRHRQRATAA